MSTIPIKTFEAGDAILAADVNTDFANVQSGTTVLTDDNTRTEWVSRGHIVEVPGNRTFNADSNNFIENSAATQTINTNTWAQVNIGGAFRITYITPLVLQPGQVLRSHFDVNVMAVTLDPALLNTTPPPFNSSDCYQFSFWYQDASLQVRQIGCTSTYSTTIRPLSPAAPLGVSSMTNYRRIGQRCNHTLCYINNTGAPVTINWLEVRARIWDTTWIDAVQLRYATWTTFVARY